MFILGNRQFNDLYLKIWLHAPDFFIRCINDVKPIGDRETPIFVYIRNNPQQIDTTLFIRDECDFTYQNAQGKNCLMVALELERPYI